MSRFSDLVRYHAEVKFGEGNEPAISDWVTYWTGTLSRNWELIGNFRTRFEINFDGKTVLDIGCGTGGLSRIVTEEGGFYIGCDFYPAILEMAQAFAFDLPHPENAQVIRASATHLPLAGSSIDFIVAFDVIEHLVGGESWQRLLLQEIRRVLRRNGLLLLTTPNRLHPWEGHTLLYGPQYLPVWLADRYIRWRNPSFLQEYKTFGEVHLLTPWKMKKLLENSGLRLVNDNPWGKKLEDYPAGKQICLRVLSGCGLGWAAPRSFWIAACRTEDWEQMVPGRIRSLRR